MKNTDFPTVIQLNRVPRQKLGRGNINEDVRHFPDTGNKRGWEQLWAQNLCNNPSTWSSGSV